MSLTTLSTSDSGSMGVILDSVGLRSKCGGRSVKLRGRSRKFSGLTGSLSEETKIRRRELLPLSTMR